MDNITIIVNGIERHYRGTHDEMMANDWQEIMMDHLESNGDYDDK